MDEKLEQAITLFRRSYSGHLSPVERDELELLLKDKEVQQVYRKWMNNQLIAEGLDEEQRFPHAKGFQAFKSRIVDQRAERKKRRLYRISTAAAVLFLLATATTWGLLDTRTQTPEVMVAQQATSPLITPGTKKALLRLSNGNVVQVGGETLELHEREGVHISHANGSIQYATASDITELIYNELHTPSKGEFYVELDDKTRVWINSDTRLRYPVKFVGQERRVVLTGEAFFEVSPDSKPFIVETSLGEIRVLGTSFDVKAYPNESMATTLVTGKVVYSGTGQMEIMPGEQLIAHSAGRIEKKKVDTREYTGWKDGLYVFNKKSLEWIAKDLERWYDITIVFKSEQLKRVPFTGHLKRYDTINVFLDLLRETGEVDYGIRDNVITLY